MFLKGIMAAFFMWFLMGCLGGLIGLFHFRLPLSL